MITTQCRMPMGLDIVIDDGASGQLPPAPQSTGVDPYGTGVAPHGAGVDPHGTRVDAYCAGVAPDGTRVDPYGIRVEAALPPRCARRLIARDSGEYLFVGLPGGRGADLVPAPLDLLLGPGDICFYDADHPPMLDFPERFRMKAFLVSCELLEVEATAVHCLLTAPVRRTSRLGTLLSPFLSELADTVTVSRPPVGELLAWNAVNVLATLAAEQLGEDATGTPDNRSPMVAKILEFIELRLTDADLSPESIAAAHHISVRYLHKLFKEEGTTVGRWIQRRRLEECRRDLMLRGRGSGTIAAVAGRWGFLSAPHFSRVFRAAYGMSPSEWRDGAGHGRRGRRG